MNKEQALLAAMLSSGNPLFIQIARKMEKLSGWTVYDVQAILQEKLAAAKGGAR